jgi:hypothetical protein
MGSYPALFDESASAGGDCAPEIVRGLLHPLGSRIANRVRLKAGSQQIPSGVYEHALASARAHVVSNEKTVEHASPL